MIPARRWRIRRASFALGVLSIPKWVDRQAALIADNEMMFIDVPPGDENAIEAAIAVSDFIIMPTRSAVADLSRIWPVSYTHL